MLTGTRIRTVFVPLNIWCNGEQSRLDLPPLALPAKDALEIEKRTRKALDLRHESRRYVNCCERMYGISLELLKASLVHVEFQCALGLDGQYAGNDVPRGFIDILAVINRYRRRFDERLDKPLPQGVESNPKNVQSSRLGSVFIPPRHPSMAAQLGIFKTISANENFAQLVINRGSMTTQWTVDDVFKTAQRRLDVLERAKCKDCGLIDIMDRG